jgi:hypothetical protein
VVFSSVDDDSWRPELTEGTETYCDRCAWHGKLNVLKN